MIRFRRYTHLARRAVELARSRTLSRAVQFRVFHWLGRRLQISSDTGSRSVPLEAANALYMLNTEVQSVRALEKQRIRTTTGIMESGSVEDSYPCVFEYEERILRYAYHPAEETSRGLVVTFHGFNAFLHMGPTRPWAEFDVLAPWDVFGWRRQGSWFWGDRGDNYVERMVKALLSEHIKQDKPWFCYGASMGGFGALYHGIQGHADGVYVACPQVDIRAKIEDYGVDNQDNPYGYLRGETLDSAPDLLGMARAQDDLPPLMLIQNQYDPVNYFADHAFKLLEIYNEKQAWYGLRVFPAIGHETFSASAEEAAYFFNLIIDKSPPRRTPFRAQ